MGRLKTAKVGAGRAGGAKPGTGTPLYVQVANSLKEAIVSGEYPVGSLLPTEDSLCEHFSVSRYTVREALRLLRNDGLVSSRRGAGTEVIPPRVSDSDIHQVMSINDLVVFAVDTRLQIESTRMVVIDSKLSERVGLLAGEERLEVCGYRYMDGIDVPVCWTAYYIHRDFATVGRLLQRHTGPVFSLIEDLFGQNIVEVHQQISATLLTPELATAFGESEGSAALEVRRIYTTADNRAAQVTINIHPASRYQHSMTMQRVKSEQ